MSKVVTIQVTIPDNRKAWRLKAALDMSFDWIEKIEVTEEKEAS